MKTKWKLVVTGDEEDELEVWQYKRFSDTTLCNTVALELRHRAFGTVNTALILALLLLTVYSVGTGNLQLFSILLLELY